MGQATAVSERGIVLSPDAVRFGELHRDAERRGELTFCLHPDERVRIIARLIREAKQ